MRRYLSFFLIFGLFFSCGNYLNKIELSPLFSDGMVLQRNTMVNVWGKSSPNTEIEIISEWGQELKLKSDATGSWRGKLLTPEAGGPFLLEIISGNKNISINDVLIGEIWLASGQSNMEMTLKGYPPNDTILNSANEILNANYPSIRMFTVEKNISIEPINKLKGSWIQASSKQVENFSSTAYFFAREIYENLNIPIGIIHSSWGGSPAESWTSETKLKDLGLFLETLENIEKSNPEDIKERWFKKFDSVDIPKQKYPEDMLEDQYEKIEFSDNELSKIEFDDQIWGDAILPGQFDTLISKQFDGAVWFRKEIIIDDVTSDYNLNIGYIDDMDKTYFNGNFIGGLSGYGYWNKKRQYKIPKSFLKKGKNIIAIRAIDMVGPGNFGGLMNLSNDSGEIISIEGVWKYKPIAEIYENKFYIYESKSFILNRPFFIKINPFLPKVLFNSMINPLIPYTIKGAIWYQGESNVGRHEQYTYLFPGMIEDWRSRWEEEFPFYFVQIAPFKYEKDPENNVSQKLRDAQRITLRLPKTGMVVTLDIGNFSNIHPANKQEVGKRLARLALVNDYDSDLTPLGPVLIDSEVTNNSIKLGFNHVGSGLKYLDNEINQFEVASSDMEFFEADVSVKGNHIFVSSQFVKNPKYVRYAWSDTPKATLFNGDGFPASSFMVENK